MSDPFPYVQSGTRRVVFKGDDDHVHELRFEGAWYRRDLTASSGAPLCASRPETLMYDASTRVIFRSAGSHLCEIRSNGGTWACTDLTNTASAPRATGSPACHVIGDIGYVVYRAADGSLHEILRSDYEPEWHDRAITPASGGPSKPLYNPGVCRSVRGIRCVLYLGRDNHIHMLRGDVSWEHTDLTNIAGAPAGCEGPSVYADGFDDHFVYCDSGGHVYEMGPDGAWEDLTLAVPGSPAAVGRPYGFVEGAERCAIFRAADGRIYGLYYNGTWGLESGMAASGCPEAAGNPRGYALEGGRYVVFRGTDDHVYELKREAGLWSYTDLTSVAVPG